MNYIETAGSIYREISETPRESLLYRLYHRTARLSGLFYLIYKIKNYPGLKLKDVSDFPPESLSDYFRKRTVPGFFIFPDQKGSFTELWRENFSSEKEKLVRLADDICLHKISSFDLTDYSWGKSIDWHVSPRGGKVWPEKHWSRMDISKEGMDDVKYTWQLNRHQHFYALGRAYWATGDEKYADEFIRQMTGWFRDNPPEIGINWTSSLEVSVRIVSWIWSFHFFASSPKFTGSFLEEFLKNIYFAASYIESNLNFSRYCVPNDHLIGEAFALFACGIIFPEFKRSEKWKATGLKILLKELDKQVHNDGVYFMHSPYYQRFVMEFYVSFFVLANLNKIAISDETKKRFSKMIAFIHSLSDKSGHVPDFGENDGSKLLYLSNAGQNDFQPLLESSVMACFGKPLRNRKLCEETFWLFGKKYLDIKKGDDLMALEKSDRFPAGGYYFMQNETGRLIFRCGGVNSYAHADMLSFVFEMNGKPVFLDNGTYLYNSDIKWRDYFKSTSAHNTVRIDGLDQMINRRKFKWLSPNPGKLIKFAKSDDGYYIEGVHRGYLRLKNPVIHNRAIRFKKGKVAITDNFSGQGRHKFEFYFHIPKTGYEVDLKSKKFIFNIDGRRIEIRPKGPETLEIEAKTASENPISGWHSPSYGYKEPCITVKYCMETEMPYEQTFSISII